MFLAKGNVIGIAVACMATAGTAQQMAGPNCHVTYRAELSPSGAKVKAVQRLMGAASVPEGLRFGGQDWLYYLNGDFDNHAIWRAEDRGATLGGAGPVTIDGRVNGDAVDPDLVPLPDGRVRLYYYEGFFTRPINGPKPAHIYSAISNDGLSFQREGIAATVEGGTDPSVVRVGNGYLMAVARGEALEIVILHSSDGRRFSHLTTLRGGIPELRALKGGDVSLIYQERDGFVERRSSDGGESWSTPKPFAQGADMRGAASPSVVAGADGSAVLYYFKTEEGCSTPPDAYFSGAAAGHTAPPLGQGAQARPSAGQPVGQPMGQPVQGNGAAMGPPPLGHGVTPTGPATR